MPVGAISGTAAIFDLGSLMSKGGYINAIATWSIDTKQSVDEYIAFISSEGQVFVYEGTDPATAPTFALVGVYNLGAPIGRRCFLRISGSSSAIQKGHWLFLIFRRSSMKLPFNMS
jgi:hypothetical protein